MKSHSRRQIVTRLRAYLERDHLPRFEMAFALLATFGVGFASSVVMLRRGMTEMWQRYPLAALAGYVTFILVVMVLVKLYHARAESELADVVDVSPDSSSSGFDSLDVPDVFDAGGCGDEGCAIIAAAALVLGLGAVSFYFIATAPTLLAELLLDSLLVGGLYHRLRTRTSTPWIVNAVRRTIWPALLVIFLLWVSAGAFGVYAPEAHSIGGVVEEWNRRH